MASPEYAQVQAATNLLGRILAGISLTDQRPPGVGGRELVADVALDSIATDPEQHAVSTVATLPSGDRYLIRVEWLSEESP